MANVQELLADPQKFIQYSKDNFEEISKVIVDLNNHGILYRTFRAMNTGVNSLFFPWTFASSKYDPALSNLLNSKMESTVVDVNKIFSYSAALAFTIPGAPKMSKPVPATIGFGVGAVFPVISMVYMVMTFVEMIFNTDGVTEAYVTKDKKLIIPGLPKATTYISERMTEILNDDEITAVLLHEVGHNTMVWRTIITGLFSKYAGMLFGGVVGGSIAGVLDMEESILIGLILFLFASMLFSFYLYRKIEWKADNFAIDCGYGDALASAFNKMNSYYSGGAFKLSGFNIVEQIANVFGTAFFQLGKLLSFLRLSNHPYIMDRIKNAYTNRGITPGPLPIGNRSQLNLDAIKASINENPDAFEAFNNLDRLDQTFEKIINANIKVIDSNL